MAYLLHLLILILLYICFALGLALTLGFTGLVNLGHIALVGIGAYTSALLMTDFHMSFWLAALSGAILSGIFGVILALPTKKIKGDYFSLLTLGFSFIAYAVFMNWSSITHGALGVAGISRPAGFLMNTQFVWLVLALTGVTYLISHRIVSSPFGRVMQAVRDDETAAQVLGKNVWKTKLIIMGLSGFLAGLAGAFFASFLQFIDPSSFMLPEIATLLSMLLIGGLGYLPAAVVGVVVVFLFFEPLRFLPIPPEAIGPLRQIFYSLLTILILLFRPKGIWGKIELE